ncbi:MAG: methyltransferase [Pseudomonadota bacterium]
MDQRLKLAIEAGHVALTRAEAETGRIALWGPGADTDLSFLDPDRVVVLQNFKPDAEAFEARGFSVFPETTAAAQGMFEQSLVFLPRARGALRDRVARASAQTQGPLIIDGLKTEGADSLYKALKPIAELGAAFSKSHGKTFEARFEQNSEGLEGWRGEMSEAVPGFQTYPGVFSADKIDRGSALLVEHLPQKLSGHWADFGAGWGFLSKAICERGVAHVDCIEADHAALSCAQVNLEGAPAAFYWEDIRHFAPRASYDGIISNPPFHVSRKSDARLGQAFIDAAAQALSPRGRFWMVANRHLPYEASLETCFAQWSEVASADGFKVFCAERPRSKAPARVSVRRNAR